jgi:hypothetical protein
VDVAQLVEPRVVIPVVVGSSPIVHPKLARRSGQKPRFLPAVDAVMSAEIAGGDFGQLNKGR